MSTELEATTKNPDKFNLDGSDQPSSASTSGVALKYFADLSKVIESDHTAVAGETEIVSGLAVRKPHKQEWFRVHPDNSYSISTRIIEEKETKEVYWITPDLWSKFVGQSKSVLLTVCVTEQKSLFVWAITNPDPRGRSSSWVESAHRAAYEAKSKWIRIESDMDQQRYRIFTPESVLPDPEWPSWTMSEILELAFKNRVMDSLEHPLARHLRGVR